MREAALTLLACPACGGELSLSDVAERAADGHVMHGALACAGCASSYRVERGVPRLVGRTVAREATETAARFGSQWKTFDHLADYQEEWLRSWLDPVGPDDCRGKIVLEAGCGKGRHTVVMAGWGALHVVALDLSDAVDVAFANTRALKNAHVVQGDLLHPPLKRAFDLAFCIGVLHHLPDPRAGFAALRGAVKPGGKLAVWVYGLESNEWIVRLVNPVREKVTSRMPANLLYWLSWAPSAALATAVKTCLRPPLASRLPYGEYLRKLADLPVREVHNIVFDQLVTPIAFYLPQSEVRSWFEEPGLTDVRISWHNRNSWRGSATVAE